MLPISYSLLVFALTSFVVAGSTPGSTSSEPDPKLRWPQFYAQEEWQALVLNNNPYLIEDWNEKYWYRLKPIKKKDEKPLWPDDRDLEDIMQFTVSRMQCIMQCLKQHMMQQPIEDDSDGSSLSPFEKREKKRPHIYGIHAASYSRFRRAPRGDNELRLQLPEQRRYESVVFHHDLLLEESEGKRFPLEGFWGQSTMLEPSQGERDGPVVTHVNHIIEIQWNTGNSRWEVRFLDPTKDTRRFTPAMTVYKLGAAPKRGKKRKQVASTEEKPPAQKKPRRPRVSQLRPLRSRRE